MTPKMTSAVESMNVSESKKISSCGTHDLFVEKFRYVPALSSIMRKAMHAHATDILQLVLDPSPVYSKGLRIGGP